MPDSTQATDLKKALLRLTIATVGLYLIVVAVVVFLAVIAWNGRAQSHRTNVALCAFRSDLQSRIAAEQITLKHPAEFGIPAAVLGSLRITAAGQQSTVDALKGVKCSD